MQTGSAKRGYQPRPEERNILRSCGSPNGIVTFLDLLKRYEWLGLYFCHPSTAILRLASRCRFTLSFLEANGAAYWVMLMPLMLRFDKSVQWPAQVAIQAVHAQEPTSCTSQTLRLDLKKRNEFQQSNNLFVIRYGPSIFSILRPAAWPSSEIAQPDRHHRFASVRFPKNVPDYGTVWHKCCPP